MNRKNVKNKVEGFSKKTKEEKIKWLKENYFNNNSNEILNKYWNSDSSLQKIHDEFTENTISNFYLPIGVAPNFLIDNNDYTIPMVIEESSVVAAACKAAKFWRNKGGFKTSIISLKKTGQVHFIFKGDKSKLEKFFKENRSKFFEDCKEISSNMKKRGGGILDIELIDKTHDIDNLGFADVFGGPGGFGKVLDAYSFHVSKFVKNTRRGAELWRRKQKRITTEKVTTT